jgi:sigma-54 dependent transcriptional regulator, acetoin dehydrogenase operon transcriptional activator AcoR
MPDLVRDLRYELMRVGLRGDIRAGGVVPDLIVRSWRRSISGSVPGDAPATRYQEVDADSLLCRASAPILDRWQSQLADTGVTLLLSDRSGSIVMRRASDSSVRRRLDKVHAAEGFDYSEDSVGTNGLGTSLAEKGAVFIAGSQHFNDLLAGLTCAATSVSAPGGSVIGSISLSARNAQASPLMLSLTREIGQQIEERLRRTSRPEDLALAMSFMRYTNSQRPTVVMDRESMLANTPGLPYVNVSSHVLLWELLTSHDWSSGGQVADLRLSGTSRTVSARRVTDGPRPHYVLHFDDVEPALAAAAEPASRAAGIPRVSAGAPVQRRGGVALVEGPPGSGRATVAMGLRKESKPEICAPAPDTDWVSWARRLKDGTDLLIRDVDTLGGGDVARLENLVAEHRSACLAGRRSSWLLLTASRDRSSGRVRALIDAVGPRTVIEPLSATPERIPGLVRRVLDEADPRRRHTMSPAALQSLVQWSWPGNITELVGVLSALVREVPGSVIQRRHLPRHLQQAPPRRRLTMLEAAEREAIIRALAASGGNKSEAAGLLGIGRTTLYRRLKHFGLDGGESSL